MDLDFGFVQWPQTVAFRWSNATWGASVAFPVCGAVVYLAATYFLRQFHIRESFVLKAFERFHNVLLIVLSLSMCIGTIVAAVERATADGVFSLVCSHRPPASLWDGAFGFWTYIFYLSKFWEFFDTFLLAVQQKKLLVLQMWHHSVMPLVCWSWFSYPWLEGAWWCTMVNSAIHTAMYTYYLQTSLGYKAAWKVYMTMAQIVQFITGFLFVAIFLCLQYAGYNCSGNTNTAIFSLAANLSFLALFIKFYFETYKQGGDKRAAVQREIGDAPAQRSTLKKKI